MVWLIGNLSVIPTKSHDFAKKPPFVKKLCFFSGVAPCRQRMSKCRAPSSMHYHGHQKLQRLQLSWVILSHPSCTVQFRGKSFGVEKSAQNPWNLKPQSRELWWEAKGQFYMSDLCWLLLIHEDNDATEHSGIKHDINEINLWKASLWQ